MLFTRIGEFFTSISIKIDKWFYRSEVKRMVKRAVKKYEDVFYVPVDRKVNSKLRHHYRLYGQNLNRPAVLLMQSLADQGEPYLWQENGARFEPESPYPHLDGE